jgi:predicted AlkP superfamily pyrophosphatase or phosphodiesterase
MRYFLAFLLITASGNGFLDAALPSSGKAEHVVLVVWDGMRPDFITPQYTPTLYQLARRGVFFQNHHPVYISSTEVNGAAIATGCYPDRTGIIANRDYRPELNWQDSLGTETIEAIRRGDLLTGDRFIAVPTLAEILHDAGRRTVIAGTKPVALLHDRQSRRRSPAARDSVMLQNGHSIPRKIADEVKKANDKKDFPTNSTPNTARDAWTTKGLTDVLWKDSVPQFTLLWLSDPDASQHASSPGSETSLAGLESSDNNLAAVIKKLEDRRLLEKTDIFVVSDHGFSTIQRVADVTAILKRAQFNAGKKLDDAEPGDVVVVGLGGSVMLYVIDHNENVIRDLVTFLQGSDFAGVIFSRLPLQGTFSLDQVRLGSTNPTPDIVVSLRWSSQDNQYGAPGMVASEGGKKGDGTHASLSPFDMHNTLVGAGPDLRSGFLDRLPTGNADLAPTILWILGVEPRVKMDGRILNEALAARGEISIPTPDQKVIRARAELGPMRWNQYLKFTTMGAQIYFDEGDGRPEPAN